MTKETAPLILHLSVAVCTVLWIVWHGEKMKRDIKKMFAAEDARIEAKLKALYNTTDD